MNVTGLRCEYRSDPIGLDVRGPRLFWRLEDERRGARQTAYQIRAAGGAGELASAALWDSGQVLSEQSTQVPWQGPALNSRQRVCWQVRVWDQNGEASVWSPPASFEMGLLEPSAWQAQWIAGAPAGGRMSAAPAPHLRKAFTIGRPVTSARLYISALGLYEARLNGQRVGDDVFTPGWTNYFRRVQYHTYDVTAMLQPGENVLGAILGDGWYCGRVGASTRQNYGERPELLAQLVLTHADGTTQTIVTDGSWKASAGPILYADLIDGEYYDARRELPGWDAAHFDDANWTVVQTCTHDLILSAPPGPPVRRILEIAPVAAPRQIWKHQNGRRPVWIFDLGQNMVGRVRLKVSGPRGALVGLRHAEMLDDKGQLYTENLRSAKATDYYVLKGSPAASPEVWEPRFTFHGFRYVEVDFLDPVQHAAAGDHTPTLETVTGIVLHSDTPATGTFGCSNPLVNQLQHNIQWGQRGNFLEVPTDCPQRDERLGWTGDAQVFIRTATHNMEVAGFFTKWLRDMADDQSEDGSIPHYIPAPALRLVKNLSGEAAWADAALICPWTIYQAYGDDRILREHYPMFQRFAEHLWNTSADYTRGAHTGKGWAGFGDWLATDAGRDNLSGLTPKDLISTAFFAYALQLLAKIATVLDKPQDAARYADLGAKARQAFLRRFVTPAGFVHGHTQTAYVLALYFDLLPAELRPAAAQALAQDIQTRDNHLSTGFVGTPYLAHVLTREGYLDLAYTLLLQKTWPSWLYPVTQGATTIWERWDGWTHDKGFQNPGMNSFNHYAYGAIGHWLYATVAGLDLDEQHPGYRHVIVHPRPGGGLTHAQAELQSLHGPIRVAWRLAEGRFHLDLHIPPTATATVILPTQEASVVQEGGRPLGQAEGIETIMPVSGEVTLKVASGRYQFVMPYGRD